MNKHLIIFNHMFQTNVDSYTRLEFNDLKDVFIELEKLGVNKQDKKDQGKLMGAYSFIPPEEVKSSEKGNDRRRYNVDKLHLAVIDFDSGSQEDLNKVEQLISSFRYIKYSSFNHNPANKKIKYRFLLELQHSIPSHNIKAFMTYFDYKYVSGLNDKQCRAVSQAFFLPCHNIHTGIECKLEYHEGDVLAVSDTYLEESSEQLLDLYNIDLNGIESVKAEEGDFQEIAVRLSKSSKTSDVKSANIINEIISTGTFDEKQAGGNHTTLLTTSTAIGRCKPEMDVSSIFDFFNSTQEDKNNSYTDPQLMKVITDGFHAGARWNLKIAAETESKKKQSDTPRSSNVSEDIKIRCHEMGIAVSDFYKYLIIVRGGHYLMYVPDKRKYVQYSKDHFAVAIEQVLALKDICGEEGVVEMYSTTIVKDKVLTKAKKIDSLIAEYGVVCTTEKIFIDNSVEFEYYDPKSREFRNRRLKPRDITPKFNKGVDDWLKLLSPEDPTVYTDICKWISYSLDLSAPLSILYLDGAPGAGKSLIGRILSQNWSEQGGAISADHVLGAPFNGQLMDCPIVCADERLPIIPNKNMSDVLRDFVANGTPTIRDLYSKGYQVQGYFRLILAANNPNLLQIKMSHADTPEDLEALASRFFYVKVSKDASEYLTNIGSNDSGTVQRWIMEDVGIAHFKWIAENTDISNRTRFGVSRGKEYVKSIMKTDTIEYSILSMLVVYLSSEDKERLEYFSGGSFLVAEKHIWVSASDLFSVWQDVNKSKTPNRGLISSELSSLASMSKRKVKKKVSTAGDSKKKATTHRFSGGSTLKHGISASRLVDHAITTRLSDPATILSALGYSDEAIDAYILTQDD